MSRKEARTSPQPYAQADIWYATHSSAFSYSYHLIDFFSFKLRGLFVSQRVLLRCRQPESGDQVDQKHQVPPQDKDGNCYSTKRGTSKFSRDPERFAGTGGGGSRRRVGQAPRRAGRGDPSSSRPIGRSPLPETPLSSLSRWSCAGGSQEQKQRRHLVLCKTQNCQHHQGHHHHPNSPQNHNKNDGTFAGEKSLLQGPR